MTKPFSKPTYTQFSNDAIDTVMREVSPNAWKIITVAIRKTYGWHKQADTISYSQFIELTGISSRATISSAIKEVLEKGILLRRENGNSYEYELNRDYMVQKSNQYRNCTDTSTETVPIEPKNGTETVHTKESIKENKEISAKAETHDFLEELRERKPEPKKPTLEKTNLPIDWVIVSGGKVKKENLEASRRDTIRDRLETWKTSEREKDLARTFAEAFGIKPPRAEEEYYHAWIAGTKNLMNIEGDGDIHQVIRAIAADHKEKGFDGVVAPSSLEREVYKRMNRVLETPEYTKGNRIGA